MNNSLFCLVRYLRERGYDAELLAEEEAEHFAPACDTYDSAYQKYSRSVNWVKETFWTTKQDSVKKELSRYDFIIAQGYPAAFAYRAGREIDIYIPYGSDLYERAFRLQDYPWKKRLISFLKTRIKRDSARFYLGTPEKFLRKSIQRAKYVICSETNPEFEEKMNELNLRGKRIVAALPIVYWPEYDPQRIGKNANQTRWYEEFYKIRKKFDLVIFHHGRHVWKTRVDDFSFKGNDSLIKGFSDFVKKNSAFRACLVTLEYGADVQESKNLIQELGIKEKVFWFPKMQRKDLMFGIYFSDICTGEFDKSWLVFGTILEAMVMGKPILHYRDDSLYKAYPELYPLINAKSAEEISRSLSDYVSNPEKYKEMGRKARQWFLKYIVEQPVDQIVQIIEEARKSKQLCKEAR